MAKTQAEPGRLTNKDREEIAAWQAAEDIQSDGKWGHQSWAQAKLKAAKYKGDLAKALKAANFFAIVAMWGWALAAVCGIASVW